MSSVLEYVSMGFIVSIAGFIAWAVKQVKSFGAAQKKLGEGQKDIETRIFTSPREKTLVEEHLGYRHVTHEEIKSNHDTVMHAIHAFSSRQDDKDEALKDDIHEIKTDIKELRTSKVDK